jgi:MoaA/NifB/PqqE/SkfB family radical SAM enzyme
MPEAPGDLGPEQVAAILDRFPAVRRVVLHGIGEPLLNRDLPEIVALVKQRGAYALFNTNGLLLRGGMAERVARSGLDELRVSLDSATPATYRRVRGVDGFQRIIDNLQRFADVKRMLRVETPRVSLWLTGMKSNILELPGLVNTAHAIGVSEVYLQRLVFSGRGLAVQEQALFRRASQAETAAIEFAERLAAELGISLHGSGDTAAGDLSPLHGAGSYQACRRPWTLMYITAHGNVLPCCISPFTGVPYGEIVLGNIFNESVEEIWNGPRYQAWRRGMTGGSPPAACSGCGEGWSL